MEVRLSTINISKWAIALHNKGHFIPGYGSYYGSSITIVNVAAFPKNTTVTLSHDLQRTDVAFISNENGRCNQTEGMNEWLVNQCLV
jgi:hypothetical protein